MEGYYERKENSVNPAVEESSLLDSVSDLPEQPPAKIRKMNPKKLYVEDSSEKYPSDPGKRPPISSYHPNIREEVRIYYLQKKSCQPKAHKFPFNNDGKRKRMFVNDWFDEFPDYLKYSIDKDETFCLCCYLFKLAVGQQAGGETFVTKGFNIWKDKKPISLQSGGSNLTHNQTARSCDALLNSRQHIENVLLKYTDQDRIDYQTCLSASIGAIRILLKQRLPFRGHFKAVTLKNAPKNWKLTSPDIQKDIGSAISSEIISTIASKIGDSLFALLVDESRDMSCKEQMAIVLRYVDGGKVIERFMGIEHVTNTNSATLKEAIDDFFSRHGLSISRLRGQGCDGASNMRGELNGLKSLILKENESAVYVHYFAHQLQLALVGVAKNYDDISDFFELIASVGNVVGASAKRRDIIREKYGDDILEAIDNNALLSGQGLNQETSLKRSSDTRWSSHYDTLINLARMFNFVIVVLDVVRIDGGASSVQKLEAKVLMDYMQSYDFIFSLCLMRKILGITNDLSKALQRKDQDIVNAMSLVTVCNEPLQTLRESGWDDLLTQVFSFCEKHHIKVLSMDDRFEPPGRLKRKSKVIINLHHFLVDLFYTVIDKQLQELGDRFNENNTKLLICMPSLNPNSSFSAFDKGKVIRLAQCYPQDFSKHEIDVLDDQLENYIIDMCSDIKFFDLRGITELAEKLVH